jgi:hypothetical protein
MRRITLTMLLFWAASVVAVAQTSSPSPIKVAEGSYAGHDHWVMFRVPAGYDVEIKLSLDGMPKNVEMTETLRLTPEFNMRGVRYEAKHWSEVEDGVLDCTVHEQSFDCSSTFKDSVGTAKLPFRGAFAAQFGVHVALLDVPWFYSSLVSHAERNSQEPMTAGIVSLALDHGERPVMGTPADSHIGYQGRDKLTMFGRRVPCHRFRIEAQHYEATAWVADNGMLLAVDMGGDLLIAMTEFQQFVSVVPELPIGEALTETKRARVTYSNVD